MNAGISKSLNGKGVPSVDQTSEVGLGAGGPLTNSGGYH